MTILTPKDEFNKIMKKLDELEEKVENTNAEVFQRAGKKVGRDIGIAYGLIIGTILSIILPNLLKVMEFIIKMSH